MKRLSFLILTLLLWAVTAPALAAAPEPISLAEYRGRLEQSLQQLEAAQRAAFPSPADLAALRERLGSTWNVETPSGTVTADLRPVAGLLEPPARLAEAAGQLRQHVAAARALSDTSRLDVAGARERLREALDRAERQDTFFRRIFDWLSRLFRPRSVTMPATRPATPVAGAGNWIIPLIIGVAGVGLIGWSLMRAYGARGQRAVAAAVGGKATDPPLPSTPDGLLEHARRVAAEGDYKEALRVAHLAVLQHLDRLALIRYVPAQTNREHEALLRRRHAGVARTLHTMTDLVEERLYSGHGASAADFARGASLADQLWREGEEASKSAQAPTGGSSSASSR